MHGTIVCGVSDPAELAAAIQLAAALGARLGLRLVLVHVIADTRQVEHDGTEEPGTWASRRSWRRSPERSATQPRRASCSETASTGSRRPRPRKEPT